MQSPKIYRESQIVLRGCTHLTLSCFITLKQRFMTPIYQWPNWGSAGPGYHFSIGIQQTTP